LLVRAADHRPGHSARLGRSPHARYELGAAGRRRHHQQKNLGQPFAEAQEALRKSAREAGKLIKADGRRENVESIEAMRKRGLKIHTLTPEINAEWDRTVEQAWPKIRGTVVPADIYDEVMSQLKTFRAAQEGARK